MRVLLFAAVALLATSVLASTESEETNWVMAERAPGRESSGLSSVVADHANLVFRSLDANNDKLVDAEEARAGVETIQQHAPGASAEDFVALIAVADTNGDNKLSRDEFQAGLADTLENVAPELVEVEAQTARKRKFLGAVGKFVRKVGSSMKAKAAGVVNSVTGRVDKKQDACVMCQYLVERMENNVKASGAIQSGSVPQAAPSANPFAFVETESKAQDPLDFAGAAVIGATRQSTRVQRQLERQKYNEIYRVVDITLDDVCEQGMPNVLYGYCKQVYQVQSDIVDGLRYQYRPQDICFRIGMCDKNSYITQGIHSRYKTS